MSAGASMSRVHQYMILVPLICWFVVFLILTSKSSNPVSDILTKSAVSPFSSCWCACVGVRVRAYGCVRARACVSVCVCAWMVHLFMNQKVCAAHPSDFGKFCEIRNNVRAVLCACCEKVWWCSSDCVNVNIQQCFVRAWRFGDTDLVVEINVRAVIGAYARKSGGMNLVVWARHLTCSILKPHPP